MFELLFTAGVAVAGGVDDGTLVYWRISSSSHPDAQTECLLTSSSSGTTSGAVTNLVTMGSTLHGYLPLYIDIAKDSGFSELLTTSPLIEIE